MTSVLPGSRRRDIDEDLDMSDFEEHAEAAASPVESGPAESRPAESGPAELTGRERDMIVFERLWWRHAGSKEQAIREQFELSATRYYQMLNALLDNPAATAFDPIVVGRLRRLRATRARKRAGR
jgi:hypothetical protein